MADTTKVEIARDIFEVARRTAALDNVDVSTLLECLVRRYAEHVETFKQGSDASPLFSLADYEMQRDADETDDQYAARLSLFRWMIDQRVPLNSGDFVWTLFPYEGQLDQPARSDMPRSWSLLSVDGTPEWQRPHRFQLKDSSWVCSPCLR